MSADPSKTSTDVPSLGQVAGNPGDPVEAELIESAALVSRTAGQPWQGSALALQLQRVAHQSDPLADALQAELGRQSRAAYQKDWRTFTRWLASKAGGGAATGSSEVHRALVGWLCLGDEAARALVVRWIADQKRQGLASATVNRRLGLPALGGQTGRPPGPGRRPATPGEGSETGRQAPRHARALGGRHPPGPGAEGRAAGPGSRWWWSSRAGSQPGSGSAAAPQRPAPW